MLLNKHWNWEIYTCLGFFSSSNFIDAVDACKLTV
jgi:hypothetical protein